MCDRAVVSNAVYPVGQSVITECLYQLERANAQVVALQGELAQALADLEQERADRRKWEAAALEALAELDLLGGE